MTEQLDAVEKASGATFAPFASRELPARFTDVEREWAAVRQRCGVLDARFRGLLRLSGGDRITFVQGMVSNDVARLREGEGTYAALLTQQGKIVSDLRVFVLPEELWIDTPAARTATVRESLERYIIADDVEFVTDETWAPLVALEGPQAREVLRALTSEDVEDAQPFRHRDISFNGGRLRVAAVSHTGERGYLLFGPPGFGGALWERCRAAGAEPVGMEALDVLRVEAGIPWYGGDMSEAMLIAEVGLDTAISYQKGCYLGQEVVERVAARGQVHRKLVGMLCNGRVVPPADSKLIHDGAEVGWITSAVWSPARQSVIALGYLRREQWTEGSEMEVVLNTGTTAARVVPLPFYPRRD